MTKEKEITWEDVPRLAEEFEEHIKKTKPEVEEKHYSRFDYMTEEELQFWKDEHQ